MRFKPGLSAPARMISGSETAIDSGVDPHERRCGNSHCCQLATYESSSVGMMLVFHVWCKIRGMRFGLGVDNGDGVAAVTAVATAAGREFAVSPGHGAAAECCSSWCCRNRQSTRMQTAAAARWTSRISCLRPWLQLNMCALCFNLQRCPPRHGGILS